MSQPLPELRSLNSGGTQGSRGGRHPTAGNLRGCPEDAVRWACGPGCGDSAVSARAQGSACGVCSDCLDFASFACLQPGSHLNSALGSPRASLGAVHLTPWLGGQLGCVTTGLRSRGPWSLEGPELEPKAGAPTSQATLTGQKSPPVTLQSHLRGLCLVPTKLLAESAAPRRAGHSLR